MGHGCREKRGLKILRLNTARLPKKQLQILRLTTPTLCPNDEDLSLGTPEDSAWGPVRSG
jgi:hypothetical protein